MIERQRTGHRLKRNHSNAIPRYIIAFDTETKTVENGSIPKRRLHSWRLGTAISGRLVNNNIVGAKAHHFRQPAELWGLLEKLSASNYTTWVIGHNIIFDLIIAEFPTMMEKAEYVIEWPRSKRTREDNNEDNAHASGLAIIDSPPTIIALKCVATGGRIVFVDSMNWFPTTLRKIGDNLGCPKEDLPDDSDSENIWFGYCLRDSEIVFRAFHKLIKWVKENDMGMFRYTAPSQAMAAFRHRFMRHPILFHDNENVKKVERTSYFGGRTEVYRIGKISETVYQLDINSLFPSVMHAGRYPTMLDRFSLGEDYSNSLPAIDWGSSVAQVELDTPEALFPCRTPKMVYYPIGKFRTALCGRELWYAHQKGYVKSVKSWAEYRTEPIFTSFVDTLWNMRQEYKRAGNFIYEQFAKRLLNSLYGKFAQKSPKWVNLPGRMDGLPWSSWVEIDSTTGERTQYRSFGWQVQRQGEQVELANTFVAISAFVTSAARMRMNQLRSIAGRKNIYYQGVDSVIVTPEGLQRLDTAGELSQTELGKLRLELCVNDGCINGAADYQLGEKIVLSGRTREFEQADRERYYQQKFYGLQHMFDGNSLNTITEETVPWQRVSAFAKGIIGADGWIEPILLGGDRAMDIKVKLPSGEIPDTGAVGQVLTPLHFAFIESESDERSGIALYRNQRDKGMDVAAIREAIEKAGGEVVEVA